MAATCTMQQPFGPGPRGPDPRGPNGAPGPSRPEDQHHKPFFYVQPSQPFLPLQWPVPMQVPLPLGQYYPYPGESWGGGSTPGASGRDLGVTQTSHEEIIVRKEARRSPLVCLTPSTVVTCI